MSAKTHAEALAAIKDGRMTTAALIVRALPMVAEQLLIDAMQTDDPDLRRKIFETLQKPLDTVEPKQQVASFQVATLNIITNGAVPQKRPPSADVVDVETTVELLEPPASSPADEFDLASLAESLLSAADE